MKAIILAAGYATRLYPLTLSQPKHLLQVANKHILDYSMEQLEKINSIDKIYVVTNNKYHQNFLNWKTNSNFTKDIQIINDGTIENQTKLGAVGDLSLVIKQEMIDDDLLILAGDNLFEFNLEDLITQFNQNKKNMVAVYDVKDLELAKLYGIVERDHNKVITNFVEKPTKPNSTLAATCIYLFPKNSVKRVKEYLDKGNNPDRPGDYISWLHKKEDVIAYSFSGKWFDIGDQSQLKEADNYFKFKNKQVKP